MPPSNFNNNRANQQPPQKPTGKPTTSVKAGHRYILSARAQTALAAILENIIEEALEEARRLAESAGKHRVELAEVEGALRQLCERYHALWSTDIVPPAVTSATKKPPKPKK